PATTPTASPTNPGTGATPDASGLPQVGDPPEAQRGVTAVRPPGFAAGEELAGGGHGLGIIHALGALAHAQVVHGEHVGAAQAEDEHHLDGPAADAADGHERVDDRLVVHG